MKPITKESILARWTNPATRPKFATSCLLSVTEKDEHGKFCCCAQGDILREAGYDDVAIGHTEQAAADRMVAKLLGITIPHAILLRQVNDSEEGCPERALSNPEEFIGPHWEKLFDFLDWAATQEGFVAGVGELDDLLDKEETAAMSEEPRGGLCASYAGVLRERMRDDVGGRSAGSELVRLIDSLLDTLETNITRNIILCGCIELRAPQSGVRKVLETIGYKK